MFWEILPRAYLSYKIDFLLKMSNLCSVGGISFLNNLFIKLYQNIEPPKVAHVCDDVLCRQSHPEYHVHDGGDNEMGRGERLGRVEEDEGELPQ